jgi:hypothetical protein
MRLLMVATCAQQMMRYHSSAAEQPCPAGWTMPASGCLTYVLAVWLQGDSQHGD